MKDTKGQAKRKTESTLVRDAFQQFVKQLREKLRREAEMYGRKLGFKSSRKTSMLGQVKSEMRFWKQAHDSRCLRRSERDSHEL